MSENFLVEIISPSKSIFKSDFIRAAIIPNKKNRMIGVSRFDWINSKISISYI